MNIIDEAESNLLLAQARRLEFIQPRLWLAVQSTFESALASNTNNANLYVRWGAALVEQYVHELRFSAGSQALTRSNLELLSRGC